MTEAKAAAPDGAATQERVTPAEASAGEAEAPGKIVYI